uniref:Zinc knuckle CX2CX4HX4C domain-containing protein n=1 Tax=Cannabis sativa TaxID=3483 RepID=A0A803NHU1_CANSA
MLRRLQSSSPILSVYVRPWSTYPCGSGKESGSSTLMVDLALHDLAEHPLQPSSLIQAYCTYTQDENREEPSAFLAVKLLTTRHFNPEAFKKQLKEMWPERFSINVLEKEPNFFTVEFGCFGDHRRVLIGQPWHFDFKLIVMSPLEVGSVVTAKMLTSTLFWIQVSGIPFLKRSWALAIKLGEVLGRFIKVDTASLKETWGPYLRVRIEIDVAQPLPRGTGFHFQGMASPVWLEFRFENLLDFCHFCGRLNHIVNHCPEFLAKCDSSSAPPPLQYDHTLGAKIRITSNPFYIASTRTRLCPHVTHPVSLAPPSPRPPTNHIISEPSFNDPSSEYGVQYLHQPRTTPVGCYMTQVPQQNTFIRDINGSNVAPSFSAWPTSSNVVDLDSPSQSRRSVPPSAYPILHDQNININNSMSVPEQVAPSNPIVAAPAITNANISDATGYTVPVSQAFATIMADLNANQPLHFAVGSSSSPIQTSTSSAL